eukprot:CAMPEP_0198368204 /NCGR_PEP_ID=MMETSP1450-20131203/155580_1 /TAXON_ID=753684 ORGANISM="Madagascaria erythrocladiodes, Strain CCMP3234" /NCGR_SAMPLE_ID=MMETSP1450 /ASSEMBLY_ACC=CAM_ASM_001115 /LENGTH=47 /DNA_ID= /DNA_START= /DNA_END= /DNA_ORIENTATION=
MVHDLAETTFDKHSSPRKEAHFQGVVGAGHRITESELSRERSLLSQR